MPVFTEQVNTDIEQHYVVEIRRLMGNSLQVFFLSERQVESEGEDHVYSVHHPYAVCDFTVVHAYFSSEQYLRSYAKTLLWLTCWQVDTLSFLRIIPLRLLEVIEYLQYTSYHHSITLLHFMSDSTSV